MTFFYILPLPHHSSLRKIKCAKMLTAQPILIDVQISTKLIAPDATWVLNISKTLCWKIEFRHFRTHWTVFTNLATTWPSVSHWPLMLIFLQAPYTERFSDFQKPLHQHSLLTPDHRLQLSPTLTEFCFQTILTRNRLIVGPLLIGTYGESEIQ